MNATKEFTMDFKEKTTLVSLAVEKPERSNANIFDQHHIAHDVAVMVGAWNDMDLMSLSLFAVPSLYGGLMASCVYVNNGKTLPDIEAKVNEIAALWNNTTRAYKIVEGKQNGLFLLVRVVISV